MRKDPSDPSHHWELVYTSVDFLWLSDIPECSPALAFFLMQYLPAMPGGSRGHPSQTRSRMARRSEMEAWRDQAVDWATTRGIAEPQTPAEYKLLMQTVARELATLDFIRKNVLNTAANQPASKPDSQPGTDISILSINYTLRSISKPASQPASQPTASHPVIVTESSSRCTVS